MAAEIYFFSLSCIRAKVVMHVMQRTKDNFSNHETGSACHVRSLTGGPLPSHEVKSVVLLVSRLLSSLIWSEINLANCVAFEPVAEVA